MMQEKDKSTDAQVERLEKKIALLMQGLKQSKVIKEKFTQSTKLLKEKDRQLNAFLLFYLTSIPLKSYGKIA